MKELALALSLALTPQIDRGPLVEEWSKPSAISRYVIERELPQKNISLKLSTLARLAIVEEFPQTPWTEIKNGYVFKNENFFLLLKYMPKEDRFYLYIQGKEGEGVKITLKMKEDVPGYGGLALGENKLAVMGKYGKTSFFLIEVKDPYIIIHTLEGELRLHYSPSPSSF